MEGRVDHDASLGQVGFRKVCGHLPGRSAGYAVTGGTATDLDLYPIAALQPLDAESLKSIGQRNSVLGTFRRVDVGLPNGPRVTVRGGNLA
jgi:hypothetical protein